MTGVTVSRCLLHLVYFFSFYTVDFVEFGQHMTDVYRKTISSIQDPQQCAEALQLVWDYIDSLDVVENTGEHSLKSVVSTMQTARDQFTTLVRFLQRYIRLVAKALTLDTGCGIS